MYGALEAAEQVTLSGSVAPTTKQPYLSVRGLKFNLPLSGSWYLTSDDLARSGWFWDLDYWKRFFDEAARNRYNVVTFWAAHPFAEMVRVPEYPEASTIDGSTLDARITLLPQRLPDGGRPCDRHVPRDVEHPPSARLREPPWDPCDRVRFAAGA